MKNNFIFFFLIFVLFLANFSFIYAVGIQGPETSEKTIEFEPNIEKRITFGVTDAEKIKVYVEGDLTEYVTIIDPAPDSGPRTIEVVIKLPEQLTPGRYTIYLRAQELPSAPGMVGATAAMRTRIPINVYYPGKYPEYTLRIDDLNINEKTNATVNVNNFGLVQIDSAQAKIDIYDEQDNQITTIYTSTKTIIAKGNENLVAVLDSAQFNMRKGNYYGIATLTYDGIIANQTDKAPFRIGTLNVEIVDWTKEAYPNAINKFEIYIESDWSGTIEDVYAKIYTPNNLELKTPNVDAKKFDKAKLETYWDTKDLQTGEYDVKLEVFYQGKSVTKTIKVNLIEGIPPIIEQPEKSFGESMNMTTILLIIIAVLVALVILNMFFLFKKRDNDNKPDNKIERENRNNKNPPQPPRLR